MEICFAEKVKFCPNSFYETELDDSDWKSIQVPGNWEMQGFGVPVYTNNKYVFPCNPPYVNNEDLPTVFTEDGLIYLKHLREEKYISILVLLLVLRQFMLMVRG